MRHVKLIITTPDGDMLDTIFVSVPESDDPPEEEIVELLVDNFQCAETLDFLLKLDAINAVTD